MHLKNILNYMQTYISYDIFNLPNQNYWFIASVHSFPQWHLPALHTLAVFLISLHQFDLHLLQLPLTVPECLAFLSLQSTSLSSFNGKQASKSTLLASVKLKSHLECFAVIGWPGLSLSFLALLVGDCAPDLVLPSSLLPLAGDESTHSIQQAWQAA